MIIRSNLVITCSNIIVFILLLQTIQTEAAPNASEISSNEKARLKRMYALCPPKFQRIGNECYFVSHYKKNWLDAHFECKDRHSKLAEPHKYEDRRIRKYLLQFDQDHSDKWIGATFNWEKNRWQWGYSGRNLQYQAFSRMNPGAREQLKYHCAVFSANLKYRWSPRSCIDQHYFVCQHRMPLVSSKNRLRVYQKWNQTYPNELANENEVIVSNKNRNEGYTKYRIANPTDRDSNRIHIIRYDKPRNRQPQKNDINPANYGYNQKADRRSRDFHPQANLPSLPKPTVRPPHSSRSQPENPAAQATSHMSSVFREVDPASIWHRPDQSVPGNIGQRVGPIRQKIEKGPDGKPRMVMNIGQRRFGLDETNVGQQSGEQSGQRKRRRRPSTTIAPETTTTERTTTRSSTSTTTTTTERPRTHPTTPSTTISTTTRQSSEAELKKQRFRERLEKLTPEARHEFLEKWRKKKAERKARANDV